ncbi:DUF4282 domain-containing protein [Salinactinospora qingdaonensis]
MGGYPSPPDKGFFGALFDFNFDYFVTSKVIKVLYVLGMVAVALSTLISLVSAFVVMGDTPGMGIVLLVATPILGMIYLILLRIWMELLIVIFKIGEDLRAMRERGGF